MTTSSSATLSRVNTPPAQTWNYLRANDITLTVPCESRQGDVYFALPRLFEGIECGMGQQVTDWVESQATDSQYVEVKAGQKRTEPIVVSSMDAGVMVRAGAEATIVVCAAGAEPLPVSADSDSPRFASLAAELAGDTGKGPAAPVKTSAALARIIAERDATVHVLEFVAANDGVQHLESVGITADERARVDVRQFFLGAATTAAGLVCSLNGSSARFDLTCRYLGRDQELLDINHVVRMRGKNTRTNIAESGVLDGHAKKALRATIDLIHGAKGAEGTELETVLVLSDDVTNKTMPVILCDEDDVVGNHGASIGSVGPEQIQYLADRGLSQSEAEALYVRALFDEAVLAAPTHEVRAVVLERAKEVLGSQIAGDLVEGLGLADQPAKED
ncbi:MAG: SufD family Fe-S cluster assembly protein [Coriobacteriales bacterium]|nr:SufD family Fe-S cluster assembly protein [Coriobacteriales bacterium]